MSTLRVDNLSTTDSSVTVSVADLASRITNTLTVADFGAVGDGIVDDTDAFNQAAVSEKQVGVPSGSYNLSADVTGYFNIDLGVTFTGPGTAFSKIRGFWTTQPSGTNIHRLADRVFISEAAEKSRGEQESGAEGTWLITDMGANYFEREAHLLVVSDVGEYGGVFATRTSDKAALGNYGDSSVAVAGIVQNDSLSPTQIGWASYFEANRISNITTFGTEFAVKNRGNNTAANPYSYFGGAIGAWFAGGGDDFYNGSPTNPSDTAILIGNNSAPWNRGIVFGADGITGSDGVSGIGTAINFGKGHAILWSFNDSGTVRNGASVVSQVSAANQGQRITFDNTAMHLSAFDSAGATVDTVVFGAPASTPAGQGLNGLFFGAIQQGGGYTNIQASGPDTNIDVRITPKGTGVLQLGYLGQSATTPASFVAANFLQIKLSDGSTFYAAGRVNSPW